jgi:putative ABC transport system permease protein
MAARSIETFNFYGALPMLKNYLQIAFRVLLRRKMFTFISLFAISFTLVVLMVAMAILDHIYAPMPPEVRQDRTLLLLRAKMEGHGDIEMGSPGYRLLDRYMRTLPDVERTSIFSNTRTVSLYHDGFDLKPSLKYTDGEFWKILDFTFLEGKPITTEDEAAANPVAVINQATKEKLFGGGPAVGRTFEADRQNYRVVGVVANVPVYRMIPTSDIWVPISTIPERGYRDELMGEFNGMILARSAADRPRITEEFMARMGKVEFTSSMFNHMECIPGTRFDEAARDMMETSSGNATLIYTAALILAAFLFMLLPTVNLVNINISRIIERASEIGVRKSFGASARTLVGQFLVENLLLTAIGGIIGFMLSVLILSAITNSGMIPYAEFHINIRIFFYAFASILVFGVLSGVYPAWKMARMDPVNALKGIVR